MDRQEHRFGGAPTGRGATDGLRPEAIALVESPYSLLAKAITAFDEESADPFHNGPRRRERLLRDRRVRTRRLGLFGIGPRRGSGGHLSAVGRRPPSRAATATSTSGPRAASTGLTRHRPVARAASAVVPAGASRMALLSPGRRPRRRTMCRLPRISRECSPHRHGPRGLDHTLGRGEIDEQSGILISRHRRTTSDSDQVQSSASGPSKIVRQNSSFTISTDTGRPRQGGKPPAAGFSENATPRALPPPHRIADLRVHRQPRTAGSVPRPRRPPRRARPRPRILHAVVRREAELPGVHVRPVTGTPVGVDPGVGGVRQQSRVDDRRPDLLTLTRLLWWYSAEVMAIAASSASRWSPMFERLHSGGLPASQAPSSHSVPVKRAAFWSVPGRSERGPFVAPGVAEHQRG